MQSALNQFRISVGRVRDLISLHNFVQTQSTSALDTSDMLRAALVLAVSALDYYVHEVVTLCMMEIHRGERSEPAPSRNTEQSAFSRFRVSLGGARQDRLAAINLASWLETELRQAQEDALLQQAHTISSLIPIIASGLQSRLNNAAWLESEIREQLGYQSFQDAEKIAGAIRYISDKKLWDEVSKLMDMPVNNVKERLSLIVDRRNKIAHEADINPSFGIGARWDIDSLLANDAINFIEQLVETIHEVVQPN